MDILYSPQKIEYDKTLIILGNFDGLHIAHKAVIDKGIDYAKKNGLKSGVLMFENHTRNEKLITSNKQKLELLQKLNPDFVYIRKFTKEFMQKSPEEFVQELVEEMRMKAVCTGFDYRFGHKAEGNTKTLIELGQKYSFDVLVTNAVSIEGQIISSTYIRQLIGEGDMEKTKEFLGRSYCIAGIVEKGLQNGRKLGFPTANVGFEENTVLPKNGVYIGNTEIDGEKYTSVINVGNNPTFGAEKITVESHILDFSKDLYGKEIKVYFDKRIRGDIKFNSLDELINQINMDIAQARRV